MDTNDTNDTYFDRSEFLKDTASPAYRESARFREEVAAKLNRSIAAGRITTMGEQISRHQRLHERTVSNPEDSENGLTVAPSHPAWAEAGKVMIAGSVFKSPDEIANAFSAPAFDADPTYRAAVKEKIERSLREGWITPDFKPADPTQRNG